MTSDYDDSIWRQVPDRPRIPDPWLELRASVFAAGSAAALDLGCGDGLYLPALLLSAGAVFGVDRSAVALERAGRRNPAAKLRKTTAGERLPLADNSVDRVWCCDTLEHVLDTQTVLSEAGRVLVPGGRLLVVTPDHRIWSRIGLAFGGWERHFDPFSPHLRFYTRRSLTDALTGCGFEPPRVERHRGALVAESPRL
ncbi:MAG: class I SAM-dependent methyltransferase [Solirubrobacterales bacterium]